MNYKVEDSDDNLFPKKVTLILEDRASISFWVTDNNNDNPALEIFVFT